MSGFVLSNQQLCILDKYIKIITDAFCVRSAFVKIVQYNATASVFHYYFLWHYLSSRVHVCFRLCDGISYIPKVAGGAKQSKEINKIKKQMSESLQAVSQSKQSLQRGLRLVDVEKIEYLTRIHGYTERLIKQNQTFMLLW